LKRLFSWVYKIIFRGSRSNLYGVSSPLFAALIFEFCECERVDIHKSHNVTVLLYRFVCPAKYRRVVFSESVDMSLKDICLEIEKRYEVFFLEIGTDKDHIHFLLQSVPTKSPTSIIKMLKSITARDIIMYSNQQIPIS